eukprot:GEMP01031774.1.p1 GENE.GEMP01031774.1~~GEMP01031774.1.p1  ORF type:complete len:592 (+),score=110.39 GEMP01031774.1:40-1776(+)
MSSLPNVLGRVAARQDGAAPRLPTVVTPRNIADDLELNLATTLREKRAKAHHRRSPLHTIGDDIMAYVCAELQYTGLLDVKPPSLERLRVFQSAFDQVAEQLPSYRPILHAVRAEYDELLEYFVEANNSVDALEARLKLLKVESAKYVSEAQYHFEKKVGQLRAEVNSWRTKYTQCEQESSDVTTKYTKMVESAQHSQKMATDLHRQNFDLVKNYQRSQQQVEESRKKDIIIQAEVNCLKQNLKAAEELIQGAEHEIQDLHQQSSKYSNVVSLEDVTTLNDKYTNAQKTLSMTEGKLEVLQKDYDRLFTSAGSKSEGRSVTPRPAFSNNVGCVDSFASTSASEGNAVSSDEKVQFMQRLVEHLMKIGRTILGAYGLSQASTKPSLTQQTFDTILQRVPPPSIPHPLLPAAPNVPNLYFSRHTVHQIMSRFIKQRMADSVTTSPVPEALEYFISENYRRFFDDDNVYPSLVDAIERFTPEPDFLAYSLMLQGKISEFVVHDSQNLAAEVKISIMASKTDTETHTMTKQSFYFGQQRLPFARRSLFPESDSFRFAIAAFGGNARIHQRHDRCGEGSCCCQ